MIISSRTNPRLYTSLIACFFIFSSSSSAWLSISDTSSNPETWADQSSSKKIYPDCRSWWKMGGQISHCRKARTLAVSATIPSRSHQSRPPILLISCGAPLWVWRKWSLRVPLAEPPYTTNKVWPEPTEQPRGRARLRCKTAETLSAADKVWRRSVWPWHWILWTAIGEPFRRVPAYSLPLLAWHRMWASENPPVASSRSL
nr:hypothetical protein Iba_chr04eCG14290 [Ipomoea batatas]